MFGHNDNSQKQVDPIAAAHDDIAASADAIATGDSNDVTPTTGGGGTLGSFMSSAPAPAPATPAPSTPVVTPAETPAVEEAPKPEEDLASQNDPLAPRHTEQTPAPAAAPADDALLDIKHQALQALTPLVSQLEQTPEEKFKTTMMLIQASDNQSLVKEAYEAAQKITNEKERAQALLDIVNEINYFTQQA